jgi:hypothetical protein
MRGARYVASSEGNIRVPSSYISSAVFEVNADPIGKVAVFQSKVTNGARPEARQPVLRAEYPELPHFGIRDVRVDSTIHSGRSCGGPGLCASIGERCAF